MKNMKLKRKKIDEFHKINFLKDTVNKMTRQAVQTGKKYLQINSADDQLIGKKKDLNTLYQIDIRIATKYMKRCYYQSLRKCKLQPQKAKGNTTTHLPEWMQLTTLIIPSVGESVVNGLLIHCW